MMSAFGEPLAQIWSGPQEVDYLEWTSFLGICVVLLAVVVTGAFLFWRFRHYRRYIIELVTDIYKPQRTWVHVLWASLVLSVVLDLAAGLLTISTRNLGTIVAMLAAGAVLGLFAMLFFWLVSFFVASIRKLPVRVAYAPYLCYKSKRRLNKEAALQAQRVGRGAAEGE
jgi:hypothetical protein